MVPTLVIDVAIEPKTPNDFGRMLEALRLLTHDTPAIEFSFKPETGQTIVSGASENELDAAITVLQRSLDIAVVVGAPQVAYRETLVRRIEIDETHKKRGRFAKVRIIFEPTKPGAGSSFETQIVGSSVPNAYIPGVERGIASVMGSGVLAGFPVIDVKVTLVDGAWHDVDFSASAFEFVAEAAFRRALTEGGSILLEPIMKVEISFPEDYLGFVMSDLVARRGRVKDQDLRGGAIVIRAFVPLANMFGYVSQLRSGTHGRGSYTMQFSHYERLPPPQGDDPFASAAAMRATPAQSA